MEKLLTIPEVAEILGISESTAKIWASQRKFPVVKVGRLSRVSPLALKDWIRRQTEPRREGTQNPELRRPYNIIKARAFENAEERLKRKE